nr:hypothetical protein [Tanacetum cinerariifolium]
VGVLFIISSKAAPPYQLVPSPMPINQGTGGRDEWNNAWETAWLPEHLSAKNQAPLEIDVNSPSQTHHQRKKRFWIVSQAFVKDMADNWEQRRKKSGTSKSIREQEEERLMKLKENGKSLYNLENVKRDYRVMKQRIHAGL